MKFFKKFQNLTKNIFFKNSNPLDQKVEIARFIRCSISFLVLQKIVMYIQVLVLTYSRMLSQRIRSKVKTRLRYYFFCWKSKYPCSQVSHDYCISGLKRHFRSTLPVHTSGQKCFQSYTRKRVKLFPCSIPMSNLDRFG